ncbi:aries arylalkylamine N-acetyltransferase [Yamadazyma tenuis ATCC 10573]|uniref:Aries arylalkylamine N-acetyltransferase n=1 Tax=Candida tenuis (strain ATCC 10573 / BCRC 21748 / CBS 615 / JCM 9827 / NBRC 10315 / NRRL Y-1498 / VKM Y-70) TaxID=590646 RepID=G3BE40_CANTC|nr:aries arylalkylamine N-acetyltransferase [Yamadazyma tenuis ATCC 10573]EGV60452.1 aries arylalkylamine N-acetyltransferase [Yamadazyma tenuis ATCC 10573]
MSDFPPNLSIRPLTIEDVDQCIALEAKGFSKNERATLQKLKYRLTVCPELCSGLFIRDYKYKYNAINLPSVAESLEKKHEVVKRSGDDDDLEDLPMSSSVIKETLVGHIIGTKMSSARVTNEAMDLPTDNDDTTGHIEGSRYIGIHSLVIDPEWQGKNLGTLIMHDYIQKLSNQDLGDKVSLLCKDKLVPFYEKIGFNNLGQSECKFGGVSWIDMSMDLIPEDDD